jgi:hypothetical protein
VRARRVRRSTRPDVDPPALLRRALREALVAIDIITCDWLPGDGNIEPLAVTARALDAHVTDAIVAFGEADPDPPWIERCRETALRSALATTAALGAAYADRLGSPRAVLAACHAVARLIEALHAARAAPPRWN